MNEKKFNIIIKKPLAIKAKTRKDAKNFIINEFKKFNIEDDDLRIANDYRTLTQNRSIHLYCQHIADELNDKSIDMKAFFKHGHDLMWTMESVKEYIFKETCRILFGIDSTTKLTKLNQIDKVIDVITKAMAEKGCEYIPFPNKEDLLN